MKAQPEIPDSRTAGPHACLLICYNLGMEQSTDKKTASPDIALRISLLYAVTGGLWILFSDGLLALLTSDPVALSRLQTFKGWAFISVTALLLYALVSRYASEMKRQWETLRESEEIQRLLIENIRDYEIFMLDPEGHIVMWNLGAVRNKGYSAEEITGKHHSIFFPREAVEAGIPGQELRMAEAEGSFEDEGWRVRKDGSLFWADVVTTAMRDRDGKLRGFSKVIRDITERKKTEAALMESEERYRIIAETASDAIITIDQEGVIQFSNAAVEKVFGYAPSELIGQNITLLMPEHLRQAHVTALSAYVITGEKKMKWASIELPGLDKNGREVPLEISYGEFMKDDRHFFTGIIRDISERKEAALEKEYSDMLERFNMELEGLVAERTMNLLAMTLADRVRNPASVIGALAGRVLRRAEYSEKDVENIGRIITEAEKLDNTVKDFHNMLKNRQALFHFEDVSGIVREVLPIIEKEAARKQIRLSVALPDSPLRINAERNILRMAFYMILKNAVALTPDEGEISVSADGDDTSVQVVISDNGYGIPKEDIDAVLDPSSNAYGHRFVIGLPLIKQIVSEHMGEMSIKSELGQGTTLSITFPVRWKGVSQKPDNERA